MNTEPGGVDECVPPSPVQLSSVNTMPLCPLTTPDPRMGIPLQAYGTPDAGLLAGSHTALPHNHC